MRRPSPRCDPTVGRWVHNADRGLPFLPMADINCTFGACQSHLQVYPQYMETARRINRWQWEPLGCPSEGELRAETFCERLRGRRLLFVGDSLVGQQVISLLLLTNGGVNHTVFPGISESPFCAREEHRKPPLGWPQYDERPMPVCTATRWPATITYVRNELLAVDPYYSYRECAGAGCQTLYCLPFQHLLPSHDVIVLNLGAHMSGFIHGLRDSHKSWRKNAATLRKVLQAWPGLAVLGSTPRAHPGCAMYRKPLGARRRLGARPTRGRLLRSRGRRHRRRARGRGSTSAQVPKEWGWDLFDAHDALAYELIVQHYAGDNLRYLNLSDFMSQRPDAHRAWTARRRFVDCLHWFSPGVVEFWNGMLQYLLAETERAPVRAPA